MSGSAPRLVEVGVSAGTMIAPPALVDELSAAGLGEPWALVGPRPRGPGTGRGPRGVVETASGAKLLVKECRRGGVLRHLNPRLYFLRGRFLRELQTSGRAARAGLPVAETVCAVLRPHAVGFRAWTASRYVDGARDLARWLDGLAGDDDVSALYREALATVRVLHEGGLHHRDLNLGNLVATRRDGGWRVVAVDLDRARWFDGPVPDRDRRRAHARLERSWRKVFGDDGVLAQDVRRRIAREAARI